MSTKELLAHEAEAMPELLLQEVLDFLRFLRTTCLSKVDNNGEHEALWGRIDLGQTALADGWGDDAEDEARRNL